MLQVTSHLVLPPVEVPTTPGECFSQIDEVLLPIEVPMTLDVVLPPVEEVLTTPVQSFLK